MPVDNIVPLNQQPPDKKNRGNQQEGPEQNPLQVSPQRAQQWRFPAGMLGAIKMFRPLFLVGSQRLQPGHTATAMMKFRFWMKPAPACSVSDGHSPPGQPA